MSQKTASKPAPHRKPTGNRLLSCLSRTEQQRVLAQCEPVQLEFGTVLCEPGERIRAVYFPIDSYIGLLAPADQRSSLEVGLIGDEGMLGIARILDIEVSPLRAVVAGPGLTLRMSASAFAHEVERTETLRRQLNRYLYALMAQFAQSGVCARYHSITTRLARWLLTTQDRAHSNRFFFTHEFLASMLGARRVGVTAAAARLQRERLISYRRGHIVILDRIGLEASACGCYRVLQSTYARFLN